MKVKQTNITQAELDRIKERNILKAKTFYSSAPYSTKTYMALKTKLPIKFIQDNWMTITGMLFPLENK